MKPMDVVKAIATERAVSKGKIFQTLGSNRFVSNTYSYSDT
jgi:hypothetical protein